MSDTSSNSELLSSRRSARLRLIGVIVLILGLGCAAMVYWLGTRSKRLADDLDMVGYSRVQTRQMENLYGKMGPMIDDLMDDLKQPGTQAAIIAAASILVAFGCFHFARPLEHDGGQS